MKENTYIHTYNAPRPLCAIQCLKCARALCLGKAPIERKEQELSEYKCQRVVIDCLTTEILAGVNEGCGWARMHQISDLFSDCLKERLRVELCLHDLSRWPVVSLEFHRACSNICPKFRADDPSSSPCSVKMCFIIHTAGYPPVPKRAWG